MKVNGKDYTAKPGTKNLCKGCEAVAESKDCALLLEKTKCRIDGEQVIWVKDEPAID